MLLLGTKHKLLGFQAFLANEILSLLQKQPGAGAMLMVWEAPRFLVARSQVRRELSLEAAWKLGDGFPTQQRGQVLSPRRM